ncbi:MAG: 50S ribosomal protein L23 [Candidatus Diapherotrites archaeon]
MVRVVQMRGEGKKVVSEESKIKKSSEDQKLNKLDVEKKGEKASKKDLNVLPTVSGSDQEKSKPQETLSPGFLDVMIRPLVSEKAVDMIEKENKIVFITKKDATKSLIKKLFEDEFKVKVDRVNIINDLDGQKKAIIKINKGFKASDIAMKLGVL